MCCNKPISQKKNINIYIYIYIYSVRSTKYIHKKNNIRILKLYQGFRTYWCLCAQLPKKMLASDAAKVINTCRNNFLETT